MRLPTIFRSRYEGLEPPRHDGEWWTWAGESEIKDPRGYFLQEWERGGEHRYLSRLPLDVSCSASC
jgi:hypothetical protein